MSAHGARRLLFAAILLCGPVREAGAFLGGDRLHLAADITVNAAAGPPRVECSASDPVAPYSTRTWRFALGEVAPGAGADPAPAETAARCASAPGLDSAAVSLESPAIPSLLVEVTTKANLELQMEDERILVLKVSWTAKSYTGLDGRGQPVYESFMQERTLYFPDDSEVFVPLVIAGAGEGGGPVYREVVMGFRVSAQVAETARYGSIDITSGSTGAGVLLDGGLAGTTKEAGQTTLSNVPAGLHHVGIRVSSGAAPHTIVRVRPGRTVLADLRPPGSPGAAGMRLVPLGRNDRGFEEYRRPIDGAVVVRIPAGEFLMGNNETERTPHEHRVFVSEFLMDKTAVTWGQFKKFAAATGISLPRHRPYWGVFEDHPAVYVTWDEARAYCGWAGSRLPTEAEREKAARGTDDRKYPWGDEEPTPDRGVFRFTWGYAGTGPVGTHPAGASPYGVLDMGGNVWEFCSDWYSDDYYFNSPYMDPKGPPVDRHHVVRGGSWDSRPDVLSASCRSWAHRGYREGDFGFRCAMNSTGGAAGVGE